MQTITYNRSHERGRVPPEEIQVPPPVSVTVIDTGMTIKDVAHAIVWCRGYTSMEAFFQDLEHRVAVRERRKECPELYGEGGIMCESTEERRAEA